MSGKQKKVQFSDKKSYKKYPKQESGSDQSGKFLHRIFYFATKIKWKFFNVSMFKRRRS